MKSSHAAITDRFQRSKPFLLLFLLALPVRLYVAARYGYWEDEAITVTLTGPQYSLAQVFEYCTGVDRCVFFYNFFLHFWTCAFGIGEVASRLPSVVFGTLTVGFLYLLARSLVEERQAFFVGIAAAASPYLIYLSTEVRPYSLLGMFGSLASLCMVRALLSSGQARRRWMIAHAATCLAAIYTNPFGYLFWGVQFVFLAWHSRTNLRSLAPQALVPILSLPHFYFLLGALGQAAWLSPFSSYTFQKFLGVLFRLPYGFMIPTSTREEIAAVLSSPFQILSMVGGTAAMLVVVSTGVLHFRKKGPFTGGAWVFLLAGFLFLVWMLFPIRLSPRQCSLAAPYFFLLLGLGLANRTSAWWFRLSRILVSILVGVSLAFLVAGKEHPYSHTDWRGLIRSIEGAHSPNDRVYVLKDPENQRKMNLQFTLPAERYDGVNALFDLYSNGKIVPLVLEGIDSLESSKLLDRRVWVLWRNHSVSSSPLSSLSGLAKENGRTMAQRSFGKGLTAVQFGQEATSPPVDESKGRTEM